MIIYLGKIKIDSTNKDFMNICEDMDNYEHQLKKYKYKVYLVKSFKEDLFELLDDINPSIKLKVVIGEVKNKDDIIETLEYLGIDY